MRPVSRALYVSFNVSKVQGDIFALRENEQQL